MRRSLAPTIVVALLGLVIAPAIAEARSPEAGSPDVTVDGLHRGHGLYDASVRVPEPPLALALVIIGAAAMRLRDRRAARRLPTPPG